MLNWLFGGKQKSPEEITRKAPSYEDSKKIAAGHDVEAKRELAECEDLQPEYLYYFATQGEPEVRRSVARNGATPLQADVLLARDADDTVRSLVADKVSRLTPSLSIEANEKVAEMVFEILDILAHDEEPTVRAIISQQICSLDNVPKSIIDLLARDEENIVSGPILEHSPLLTDDDLIELIAKGLNSGSLTAVSKRKGLSEEISETVTTQIVDSEMTAQPSDEEETRKAVLELYNDNKLNASVILDAIDEGKISFVIHALSLLGDLPPESVRKLYTLRSARTIVAIAWKCGLTMKVAVALQERAARLSPTNIIRQSAGTEFPLSEQDMDWQLDLL